MYREIPSPQKLESTLRNSEPLPYELVPMPTFLRKCLNIPNPKLKILVLSYSTIVSPAEIMDDELQGRRGHLDTL